nr:PD40 domain-containing protein [Bacteroidota bacterium]
MGQNPPGLTGELFAPGKMSTGLQELNAVFFPDGKEVIYSVHIGVWQWAMLMMKEVDGKWTAPYPAPFNGKYGGVDQFLSKDGNRLYFCSNRPRANKDEPEADYDIWYVDRTEDGWSEPVNPGYPINTDAHEFYPSLTDDGAIYFQSRREGGIGASDIYRCKLENGQYQTAELLPPPINSEDFEGDALIAPDESYIIVSTRRVDDNIGSSDLYISFRDENNNWGELINMGEGINSTGGENCQMLSPCRKYLFYTSRQYQGQVDQSGITYKHILEKWNEPQNGYGDIYWVDAGIIDQLKPKD